MREKVILVREMIAEKDEHLAIYLSLNQQYNHQIKIYPVLNGYIYPCELLSYTVNTWDKYIHNLYKHVLKPLDTNQDNVIDYLFKHAYDDSGDLINISIFDDHNEYKVIERHIDQFTDISSFTNINIKYVDDKFVMTNDKIYEPAWLLMPDLFWIKF